MGSEGALTGRLYLAVDSTANVEAMKAEQPELGGNQPFSARL